MFHHILRVVSLMEMASCVSDARDREREGEMESRRTENHRDGKSVYINQQSLSVKIQSLGLLTVD